MSTAAEVFTESITDAETLLRHFDDLNTHPPPPDIEVLKRAGLIMAMTAWETYVEDCIREIAVGRIDSLEDDSFADFIRAKLDEEVRRLHNPGAEKTIELFRDFAGVDLSKAWHWNGLDPKAVRTRLNDYLKLRGDVVHRSRPAVRRRAECPSGQEGRPGQGDRLPEKPGSGDRSGGGGFGRT